MQNKAIVHLRVYKSNGRDSEISYSADGSVQNENILVKLRHDTLEWSNYLKHLVVNGFVKVEVEKVIDGNIDSIKKEVNDAMFPIKEVVLSPEQKKIADLEAKLDALMGKDVKVEEKTIDVVYEDVSADVATKEETLKEARERYKKVVGKRAFPGWSIDQLNEKMKK